MKVGGHNLNSKRHADDSTLIADSKDRLQLVNERLVEASQQKELNFNATKNKIMVISKSKENA